MRLGSRTDLAERIGLELAYTQRYELEINASFVPWFLETTVDDLYSTSGYEYIDLPSDFNREIENEPLYRYTTDTDETLRKLAKKDVDYALDKFQNTVGAPLLYSLTGNQIMLRPIPDDSYRLRFRYYAHDEALSATVEENHWTEFAADWLMNETGFRLALYHLQNPNLAQGFRMEADKSGQKLLRLHEARMHTNRSYQMGED